MSSHAKVKRTTVTNITGRKGGDPIVCLTAYTAPMARIMDPHVDLLLVGDSLGMVVHGMNSTIGVTLEHMILHGQAVVRGSKQALAAVDMPFGSYEESPEAAYRNAVRVMRETGCTAVKLEGGRHMAETVAALVRGGVPVMGHVGLLPQSVNVTGGYRVVGRMKEEWAAVEADAQAVAEAGAFCVVLEGVAEPLAAKITHDLPVPTIGIGASAACDGQILVTEDMLGLTEQVPTFVKRYDDLEERIGAAVAAYARDVRARSFPGKAHIYEMKSETGELPR